jgi:hypothetical protein
MRKLIVLAGLAASVSVAPRVAPAQSPAVAAQASQIVVTGTGEARVAADRATILVGVQSRGATAAAAANDNARRVRAVLDTLRVLGVGADQLSTVNYNVSPEMQYPPSGGQPPKVTGYVVTNSVRVDRLRIEEIGRVIDAALAKGANEVAGLSLFSSKADSTRRAALAAALADARAQAEVLARAAGGTLGSLIELSSAQEPIRPVLQPLMRATAAMAVQTPIESGEQTVSATVTARWTFVGGR